MGFFLAVMIFLKIRPNKNLILLSGSDKFPACSIRSISETISLSTVSLLYDDFRMRFLALNIRSISTKFCYMRL